MLPSLPLPSPSPHDGDQVLDWCIQQAKQDDMSRHVDNPSPCSQYRGAQCKAACRELACGHCLLMTHANLLETSDDSVH